MTIKYERLYGVPATANFVLWEADGVDINSSASAVLGDISIYIDEAISAATTNLFSARGASGASNHNGLGHRIVFTSAEMTGRRIGVRVVDHHGTKQYLDEVFFIETYGNENSLHNRRASGIILETTIASITDNSNFVITDKPNDNNTLLNSVALIYDDSGGAFPVDRSFRNVTSYTGGTGAVVLSSDTDFTIAAGDRVVFMPTAEVDTSDDIASAVWDVVRSDHTTGGTFGEGVLIESINAVASAQVSAIVNEALSAYGTLETNDLPTNFGSFAITGAGAVTVGTNNDKENYYPALSAYTSAAGVALTYNWSALATSTSKWPVADRSSLNALRFLRNKWAIDGTTLTVEKENDLTDAWTAALTTVASANTVTASDPT